ncbi:MAG: polysaccharide lyase [Gammaproteobacteria bacterium]|nr:polysaccharide lyase [Gammaproteobacteria bacterium]
MWKKAGGVMVYLYHMDQKGKYGDGLTLPDCRFEPGRWHRLTQRLKVNTNDDHNGVLQVWFDRQLVLDRTGLAAAGG